MKTKFFRRAAAVLLCILICAGMAFPLMGAAFAADGGPQDSVKSEPSCTCTAHCEPGAVNTDCPVCLLDLSGCTGKAPASGLSIRITPPSGWATESAAAGFCITDEAGNGFALVQVKTGENGLWHDVADDLKQRGSRWYGEVGLSENCTVYVCATGHDGKAYEKSRYIACFDRTAPTLRASIDGRLLRAEAKDDLSGVAAVYVDSKKYTDLANGTLDVPQKDLPDDYDQLSVQAVDAAGNKSGVVLVKNPNYQAGSQSPASQIQASKTTATLTPATPAPAASAAAPTTNAAAPPVTQTTTPTAAAVEPSADTYSEKSAASASMDPDGEADTTPRDPVLLTPDGQASVVDHATDADGKEFYTIRTPDENVFYLVIDRQRGAENVYFLGAITEADLTALAANGDATPQTEAVPEPEPVCICGEQCAPGAVNAECPICAENLEDCTGEASAADIEADTGTGPKEKKGGGSGMLVFVLLVVLAAGGAGFYFKIYKLRKDLDDAEDFDELLGGDEEEMVNEDEEFDVLESAVERENDAYAGASAYGEYDTYKESDTYREPDAYGEPDEPEESDSYGWEEE